MARPSRPSSLKGIISTNDDSNRCAVCFQEFMINSSKAPKLVCVTDCIFCGKQVCERCETDGGQCPVCKSPAAATRSIGLIKKKAKKGRPWAQFHLGLSFKIGRNVVQSDFESVRWLRKADKQGHPAAALALCHHSFKGSGCAVDLAEARQYAERAMLIDERLATHCRSLLYTIAAKYKYNANQTEKASKEERSILTFLANEGMKEAQYTLGMALHEDDTDVNNAEKLIVLAALQGHVDAACHVALFSMSKGKHSQAMLWSTIVSKASPDSMDPRCRPTRMEDIAGIQCDLRQLRDECGGCGAALDGKMRKYCKQCKTYCYCNRDCQKLHWNRLEGGHRDICMETLCLKEKMKNVDFDGKHFFLAV